VSQYVGSELELFRHARNWKRYYSAMIHPFLGETVLEVGAGLGATTPFLHRGAHRRWVCLETDSRLADAIRQDVEAHLLPACEVVSGTIAALPVEDPFDTILYIDVLEHIEDAQDELRRAAGLLRDGGHLVVLVPSHQSLYSEFDKAIGHHCRYDRRSLGAIMPPELVQVSSRYLDCAGMLLSFGNRLMRSSTPTEWQIGLWDKVIVPISRRLDPLLRNHLGKSLLDIRRKEVE
jgi:SAM-dependent methyltransferase